MMCEISNLPRESIAVARLHEALEADYEKFVLNSPTSLLYVSTGYRRLLKEYLDAEDHYLIALNKRAEIVAALPSFVARHSGGSVLNSLPFFGSNGGIIPSTCGEDVRHILMEAFFELARLQRCVSATLITSPFEGNNRYHESSLPYTYRDKRIGQVTDLPTGHPDVERALLEIFDDPRPRNIRRAAKAGVTVRKETDSRDFDFLVTTHQENILSIKGIAKERRFFELAKTILGPECWRLYIADLQGTRIAALLVFWFNKTVEYFTPAIHRDYRGIQPLSLLVYHAMLDATLSGYRYWNWGGTWTTQQGVYDFKRKWGAKDLPYFYYCRVYDQTLLRRPQEDIVQAFPHFYVVPFSKLDSIGGNT